MKKCPKCEAPKPFSEFDVQRTGRGDGYQAYCKVHKNQALKDWRLKNLDSCRQKERDWYKKNPTKKRTYWLTARDKHPEAYLWKAAQQRARKSGVPFSITPEDIKIPEICPVLGIPISFGATAKEDRANSPSLDRVIPELGYVPDNIVVMSHKANSIKNNATLSELEALVKWMKTDKLTSSAPTIGDYANCVSFSHQVAHHYFNYDPSKEVCCRVEY